MTRRSGFLLSLAVAAAMVATLSLPADANPQRGGGAGPRVNSGGGGGGGGSHPGGGGGGSAAPRASSPPPAPASSGGRPSGGSSGGGSYTAPPSRGGGGAVVRRAPAGSGTGGQARSRSGESSTPVPGYSRPRGDRQAIGDGAVPGYSRPRDGRPSLGTATPRTDNWRNTGVSRGWGYYPGFWGGSYYYGSRYNYPWGIGMFGLGYFYYDPFYWNYWDRWGGYGYGGYDDYYGGYGYADDGGGLRLKVTPDSAQVYVDGYYAGTVDQFNSWYQKLALQPGPHKIELRAPGFQTAIFDVDIRAGETITYKGDLAPLPKIEGDPGQPQDPVIR